MVDTGNILESVVEKISGLEAALGEINERLTKMENSGGTEKASPANNDGIIHCDLGGVVSDIVVNPDSDAGNLARKILSLFSPLDVVGGSYVRIGNERDGGYVMLDHGLFDTIAYSFGINDDVSWDQGMVDRRCDIYQFDHTIDKLPYENDRFHWSKLGIGGRTHGEFISVHDIMEQNGHLGRNDIVLKMDIEGGEWPVFETISSEDLSRFSQIVVELHSFVTGGKAHLQRVIPLLEKVSETHQSVHFHANNWGWLGLIGGVPLPDVFELTFVRKSDHNFAPCSRSFPTELDRACREGAPDYFLKL